MAGRTTDKNWEEKKPKDYHTSNSITREIRSKVSRGNICNKEYCKYIPVASAVVLLFANAVFLLAAIIVFSQQDSSQLNLNEMLSVRFEEFYNNITSLLHQYNSSLLQISSSPEVIADKIHRERWLKVVEFDMTIASTQCPVNFSLSTVDGMHICTSTSHSSGCFSTFFTTKGMAYSNFFGRIRDQYGRTNSFQPYRRGNATIDEPYVDGISLTYGQPRRHIWTFAADRNQEEAYCTCSDHEVNRIPEFVGKDYFCDTGVQFNESSSLAISNPLWDGIGCNPTYTCCLYNQPPWFYKNLPQPTSEPIELRVCRDQDKTNEDIAIEAVYVYVHY